MARGVGTQGQGAVLGGQTTTRYSLVTTLFAVIQHIFIKQKYKYKYSITKNSLFCKNCSLMTHPLQKTALMLPHLLLKLSKLVLRAFRTFDGYQTRKRLIVND